MAWTCTRCERTFAFDPCERERTAEDGPTCLDCLLTDS